MIAPKKKRAKKVAPVNRKTAMKRMAAEIVALRTLAYILLREIQKITGRPFIVVSDDVLSKTPHDATFHKVRDPQVPGFRFWVPPPKDKEVIAPPKRILLPGTGR